MAHKRFLVGMAAIALAFFATASPSVAAPSHDLHLAAAAVACSVVKTDMNLITDIDLTIINTDAAGHIVDLGDNGLTMLHQNDRAGFDQRRSAVTAAVRTNGLLTISAADGTGIVRFENVAISTSTEGLAAEATGTIAAA